jgi:hypothetical protein
MFTSGYTHDAIVPHDVIESGVAFIENAIHASRPAWQGA